MCYSGYVGMATPKHLVATRYGDVLMDKCPAEKGAVHFFIPEETPILLPDGREYLSLDTDVWNIFNGVLKYSGDPLRVKSRIPGRKSLSAFVRYEDEVSMLLDEAFAEAYDRGIIPEVKMYDPAVVASAKQIRTEHHMKTIEVSRLLKELSTDVDKRRKEYNELHSDRDSSLYFPALKLKFR